MKIDLQHKTKAKEGSIHYYWFENHHVGLQRTRFHTIEIPLEPFDSGIDYEENPVETYLTIEWIKLSVDDPSDLDGIELNDQKFPDAEASIYLGAAHNWVNIESLKITREDNLLFRLKGQIEIDFETEDVAENESFEFETTAVFGETVVTNN
jgi:hypothetical protein